MCHFSYYQSITGNDYSFIFGKVVIFADVLEIYIPVWTREVFMFNPPSLD